MDRVDLGVYSEARAEQAGDPTIITDIHNEMIEIVSNADVTAYEINADLLEFRASDTDGAVAGIPLFQIDADTLTAPEVVPTYANATF